MNASDPNFDPSKCGEVCSINPFSEFTDYCSKGEKCCPSGSFGSECASECGPYDKNGGLFLLLDWTTSIIYI